MLDKLRRFFLVLGEEGGNMALMREVRTLVARAARSGDELKDHIEGMARTLETMHDEWDGWTPHDALSETNGGPFDACDLRHWLAIARMAGVPAVPAVEILSLTEEEMSAGSGQVHIPDSPARRKLAALIERLGLATAPEPAAGAAIDIDDVREKAASAMDAVPEGYMVRNVRIGPSTLKTLAGVGVSGPEVPETRFGPDLEIGPGWVRRGNRRAVDLADKRIVEGYAHGPDGAPSVFVARPWVAAARWMISEDPHRRGTKLAGKGAWPAEWRAFAYDGRVTGVAFYYGWAGQTDPESAAVALEVRGLAQRIVDKATQIGAYPRYMDIELARRHPQAGPITDRMPRDGVSCTLDFIETDQGLLLLEGGPPFSRLGGGHPCAFAGFERAEGVAFRVVPGVSVADPKTWKDNHDRTGCILDWDEVEELAATLSRTATP